jgi:hypothetical protein
MNTHGTRYPAAVTACSVGRRVVDGQRLRWRGGLVVAGALVVVTCGCTHQPASRPGGSGAPPSLSAPSASASADLATTGQQALDAYQGMWRAYQQAVEVPDPSSPELARYATGEALSTLTKGLQSLKDQGLKGTGEIRVNPTITGAAPTSRPTQIEITDCLDSSGSHLVRASAGPAYRDSPGGHRRVVATVTRQPDGSWKINSFAAQAVGTC